VKGTSDRVTLPATTIEELKALGYVK